MKTILVASFFLLMIIGCGDNFNVAGSSYDEEEDVVALEHYENYINPNWSEVVSFVDDNKSQHIASGGRFRDFKVFDYYIDKTPKRINNLFFVYESFIFSVYDNNENIVIQHRLPRVFNMRPIWMGIGEIDNQDVIVAVNKSRATTGKYFVGIWKINGSIIYTDVLSSHYSYHFINIKGECFIFNSYREVRHLCKSK